MARLDFTRHVFSRNKANNKEVSQRPWYRQF